MPPRRRRHAADTAAKPTAETQQQHQQPGATPREAEVAGEAKKTGAVAPEVSPMAPIPPPTAARQGGEAVQGQPAATPMPAVPPDAKRAVLTKLITKRKPKMAFLFENEEAKEADNVEEATGAEVAAPKRKPKLPFLFNEEDTHDDGAAAQKQPEPEVPQAHRAADTAPRTATRIDEVKNETIEKTSTGPDTSGAAPTRTVPTTPSRQTMAISKNVKLRRKMRRGSHEVKDNTAALERAEERGDSIARMNPTNVQVEMTKTHQVHADDVTESPLPTASTESTQHGVSGDERHERTTENVSTAPNDVGAQQPSAVASQPFKHSRHLQTCEKAATSLTNGEENAQPHGKEKVEVANVIETEATSQMGQQSEAYNDQPKPPLSTDEVSAVSDTKAADMSRPTITKKRGKKSIAKKRAMRDRVAKELACKRAEEEAARKRAEEEAARKRAEEEAERKRAEEEAERKRAEEEAERKRAAEEAERKRAEEEAERKRAAEEAERKRAEEEAARKRAAEEAERKRAEEEAERKRAEEEAERKRAEEEAERKRARKAARKKAREEAERKRAEEEAARKRARKEARERAKKIVEQRKAQEAERKRAAEEAERKRAEEEAARKRAAEEAERKRAEEEAARKRAAEEAERKRAEEEAERKRAEEEAERKRAEEEAERKRAEEEAERKRAEEEAERKRAEEEAERKRAEEEAERKRAEVQVENAELSAKERRKLTKKKIERYRKKVAMRHQKPVADVIGVTAAAAQDVGDVPLVSVHACGATSAGDTPAAVPSEAMLLADALAFPNSSVTIERFDDNELVARRGSTDDAWDIGLRFDWTIKTLAIGSMPSFSSTDPRRLHPFMQRYQSRPVWFLEEVNGAKANNIREVMDVLKKSLTARFVFRK